MNAAEIAQALGGRRERKQWRARCPLHRGNSLLLCDGDGRVLVTCFGGCDRRDVLAELRRLGLLDCAPGYAVKQIPARGDAPDDGTRTTRALMLWQTARSALGTVVETYLQARCISLAELPPDARASLRFHPRCPHPSGTCLPAMLALVTHVECGAVAVHRTFLRDDGSGKAHIEPAKASLGPISGGAVRFGEPRAGERLAIAEGIETALAVALSCKIPVWAALSAHGMCQLVLPPKATDVVLCADNDSNNVGQHAANVAAHRFFAKGRLVRIALPLQAGTDFADMLAGVA